MRNRLLLALAIVTAAAMVWLLRRPSAKAPAPRGEYGAAATATPASRPGRSPAVEPTATAEETEERHTTVVVSWPPEPTPPPREEAPARRGAPAPGPDISQCVAAQASASVVPGALGRVMVDVRASNHCGRDLGPLEVWFRVSGYRQGDLVQSVLGHPFDPLPRDGETEVHIVLPGSIDWYDRIEVQVTPPSSP